MDYNAYHARVANNYMNTTNKNVLVVGCNTGKDASYFVEFRAQEVCGIDVIENVGKDYSHERVKYFKMSAEQMDFHDDMFDLVYCFATMEHIPKIEQAFAEMVRVTKPNGVIYCVAAPLWHSRNGHHKPSIFDTAKYPWIHVLFNADELKSKCKNGEISYPDWVSDIETEVDYMMNAQYFNFRPAADYINTCNSLVHVNIIRNDLQLEKEYYLALLSKDEFKMLFDRGINSTELLAVTHTFVGKKKSTRLQDPAKVGESAPDAETELEKTKRRLRRVKVKLKKIESELQKYKELTTSMESSKFWKLRKAWFSVKRKLGFLNNE